MAYILRFTQQYLPAHHQAVLELEAQFKEIWLIVGRTVDSADRKLSGMEFTDHC